VRPLLRKLWVDCGIVQQHIAVDPDQIEPTDGVILGDLTRFSPQVVRLRISICSEGDGHESNHYFSVATGCSGLEWKKILQPRIHCVLPTMFKVFPFVADQQLDNA